MKRKSKTKQRIEQIKIVKANTKMKPTNSYSHVCSDCGKTMSKNTKEYFCPKCGITEELVYDGS